MKLKASTSTALLLLARAAPAFAQTHRATARGTVTDPNGAAVLGATIKLINEGTREIRTVVSSAEGEYAGTSLCGLTGVGHQRHGPLHPRLRRGRPAAGRRRTAPVEPHTERWFNTSAFSFPAPGTFGNAGRNILERPGYQNVNASLVKNTALGERLSLQLRAEVFNLFNHPNFNLPDNFIGSPTFGRITSPRDPRHVQFGAKLLF